MTMKQQQGFPEWTTEHAPAWVRLPAIATIIVGTTRIVLATPPRLVYLAFCGAVIVAALATIKSVFLRVRRYEVKPEYRYWFKIRLGRQGIVLHLPGFSNFWTIRLDAS